MASNMIFIVKNSSQNIVKRVKDNWDITIVYSIKNNLFLILLWYSLIIIFLLIKYIVSSLIWFCNFFYINSAGGNPYVIALIYLFIRYLFFTINIKNLL